MQAHSSGTPTRDPAGAQCVPRTNSGGEEPGVPSAGATPCWQGGGAGPVRRPPAANQVSSGGQVGGPARRTGLGVLGGAWARLKVGRQLVPTKENGQSLGREEGPGAQARKGPAQLEGSCLRREAGAGEAPGWLRSGGRGGGEVGAGLPGRHGTRPSSLKPQRPSPSPWSPIPIRGLGRGRWTTQDPPPRLLHQGLGLCGQPADSLRQGWEPRIHVQPRVPTSLQPGPRGQVPCLTRLPLRGPCTASAKGLLQPRTDPGPQSKGGGGGTAGGDSTLPVPHAACWGLSGPQRTLSLQQPARGRCGLGPWRAGSGDRDGDLRASQNCPGGTCPAGWLC